MVVNLKRLVVARFFAGRFTKLAANVQAARLSTYFWVGNFLRHGQDHDRVIPFE